MNLLHIDASILGEASVSRSLSTAVVKRLKEVHPGITVTYRDLVANPLPHLTVNYLPAKYFLAGAAAVSTETEGHRRVSEVVLDEFLAANVVVIGSPMYNFTVPTQLKAWIDRIVIAGRTFRYTPEGQLIGLAADKRVICALSRGGFYGAETDYRVNEHLETYLRSILGYIGVTQLEFVIAEGIQMGPESRAKSVEAAMRLATQDGAR
jgi:FMN-dependent NADH-azoreductase